MLFGLMDRWVDEQKDGPMKLSMRYRRTLLFLRILYMSIISFSPSYPPFISYASLPLFLKFIASYVFIIIVAYKYAHVYTHNLLRSFRVIHMC